MQILFDYQAFEMQRFGGVSHSYAEIIEHLQREGCDCRIGLKESDNGHLQECGLANTIKPLHYIHKRLFEGKKWFKGQRTLTRKGMNLLGYHNDGYTLNQDYCIKLLKRQRFDIFEPTFFDPYFLPYLKGKPFVLTVHDMIPELLGVDERQNRQKKLLCPLAAFIHVPSQNTKDDLIRLLKISPEKVLITPHGAPSFPDVKYPSPYDFPYLLYVGARWAYKNFIPFLEECAIVVSKHPEIHVVCTGTPFTKEEEQIIADHGLTQHVVNTYANQTELQALYQNAEAFVYPSAYEGFGLPILEAFVNGCPVVLNNASCFAEVGGEAAVYFDIKQGGEMANCIDLILKGGHCLRVEMQEKGYKQVGLFSWEETAKSLINAYQQLL